MEAKGQKFEIAEYSATAVALAALRGKYAGVVFDVTKPDEMKAAKAARRELTTLRVNLEAKRKELKEPALRRSQLIDSEARQIRTAIEELEDPIDAQITAEERRIEAEKAAKLKAEQDRLQQIDLRIQTIAKAPAYLAGKPAAAILDAIARMEAEDLQAWAAERTEEAQKVRSDTLLLLRNMRDAALASEAEAKRQAEERARLEAEQKALAEQRAKAEAEDRARREKLEAEERAARERVQAEEERARAARRAEEEKLAAERRALEDAQRRQREEEEARQRREREAKEAAEREERRKAEEAAAAQRAKERAEQEAREAAEREARRKEAEQQDAEDMLTTFATRYGHLPRYTTVVDAIKALPPFQQLAQRKAA